MAVLASRGEGERVRREITGRPIGAVVNVTGPLTVLVEHTWLDRSATSAWGVCQLDPSPAPICGGSGAAAEPTWALS
jgi:hypothetical protein